MKKTLLILSMITLIFAGCKKFDEIEASKVEIMEEKIEKGWDYIKINVEYDYPVALEAVSLYLSEKEDMSGAEVYECNVEGKKFSIEVEGLKAGKDYYYCYEYYDEYEKVKGEKQNIKTISKPVVITKEVSSVNTISATLNGSVTNNAAINKISEMGFCWDTKQNPTIEGNHYNNGGMSGTGTSDFSYNLTSLQNNVTYYVRAYANTNYGIVYGEEKFFNIVGGNYPSVTTNNVTDITMTSATCGGNVISNGNALVTCRGVCWSTMPGPTIEDNKTNDGSDIGSYISYLTNLTPNTTYYVRAYATNEKGTAYGEEKSFMTEEKVIILPIVTTKNVSDITSNSATCGGSVISNGNALVTCRGVCWSTMPGPTIEDNKTNDGSDIGSYISYLTNLTPNTTYYVRAYATNEKGTAYGEEKSFMTEEKVIILPIVTTKNVNEITETSAICGGDVVSNGYGMITERGVCWSKNSEPTINDNKTTDGSGIGSFSSNLLNLDPNTQYYVRAYAINEKGVGYGNIKSFETLDPYNGYEYVDLGLPSGLKWATKNVGAYDSYSHGDYYAWGEINFKSEYTDDNSVTYGVEMCDIGGNSEYDVARAEWGGKWRMPTSEEFEELKNNCTWEYVGGIYPGFRFTSKVNGNTIFLPTFGYRYYTYHYGVENGFYWTSTPGSWEYYYAYGFKLQSSSEDCNLTNEERYNGFNIRPVIE